MLMIETGYCISPKHSHRKNNKLNFFLFFKPPKLRASQAAGCECIRKITG